MEAEYYAAQIGGGWFEAITTDALIEQIVEHAIDHDLGTPEAQAVHAYNDGDYEEFTTARLFAFNCNLENAFRDASDEAGYWAEHVREVSSPYLTGRI